MELDPSGALRLVRVESLKRGKLLYSGIILGQLASNFAWIYTQNTAEADLHVAGVREQNYSL